MKTNFQSAVLESDIETLLVNVFKTISPSAFVKSKVLVVSFRNFLERGTVEHCWELVPSTYKAALLSVPYSNALANSSDVTTVTPTTLSPTSPAPPAAQAVTKKILIPSNRRHQSHPITDSLLSTPSSSIGEDLVAQTKCSNPARIQRLVQAIEALQSATPLPSDSYENLWTAWTARDGLFVGVESGPRGWMCRLERGRKKIDTGLREFECASRLSLMLIPQFVDYVEKWGGLPVKSGRPGYSRRSAALDKTASDCGVAINTLKQAVARTSNYFYLLTKEGPGHVLELGSGVTSLWEKYLNHHDVDEILTYRKAKLPSLETRATLLNGIGARTFHSSLIACGWTPEALSKSTRLIDSITKYQHVPNPPIGRINDDNRHLQKRGREDDSSDANWNNPKHHCFFGPGDASCNKATKTKSTLETTSGKYTSDQFSTPSPVSPSSLSGDLQTDLNQRTDEFLTYALSAENRIYPEASAADPLGQTSPADQITAVVSQWDTVPGSVLGQQCLVPEQLNSESQVAQGNWAVCTTNDPLEIPGLSMLDFNLNWDNNFALQQRMQVETQTAITGSHMS